MDATAAVHPTDQTLQAYGLGKLDDALAESVSKDLESCPSCQRRVAEVSSDDFHGRLRGAQGAPAMSAANRSQVGDSNADRRPAAAIAPPPADTMPPGLADYPDYEVIRELGRGGMGVVYLVRNKLMGRLEVLKVVGGHLIERPGVRDRFLREVQSAAKLQHKNIVTAFSAMRLGESIVLAMEYVDGDDLAKLVKSRGPLPVINACYFIHQAALGLQHAHERGMVHRDIKPANLILAREGKRAIVKVLDFGLAKVTSEGKADSDLTGEGQMLGTPDYIAPEQIRAARSADIRADIYSLGCTFYYLLTGEPPFRGDSLWDVYQCFLKPDCPDVADRPSLTVTYIPLVIGNSAAGAGGSPENDVESRRRTPLDKPLISPATRPLETVINTLGMKLVLIPAGEFLMGSPDDDKRAPANEKPQHRVRITQPFYLGVTEVTRGQFRRFVDETGYRTEGEKDGKGAAGWNPEAKGWQPSNPKFTWRDSGNYKQTDRDPVVDVSWKDATEFAAWLSQKERQAYHLPTEAEWEYACRAGSPPLSPSGDDASAPGEYATRIDNGQWHSQPVDQFSPNAWGLQGMLGNVDEWCADGFDVTYYALSPAVDPPGPARPTARVRRGSNFFHNGPLYARPAFRRGFDPSWREDLAGFRVAMNLSPTNRASLNRPSEPTETARSAGGLPTIASERPARATAATGRQRCGAGL